MWGLWGAVASTQASKNFSTYDSLFWSDLFGALILMPFALITIARHRADFYLKNFLIVFLFAGLASCIGKIGVILLAGYLGIGGAKLPSFIISSFVFLILWLMEKNFQKKKQ